MSSNKVEWKITKFERRVGLSGEMCWNAHIQTSKYTLTVSQYDTEDKWLLDGEFKSNGMPVFQHGIGGRGCAKHILTTKEVVDTLNQLRDEHKEVKNG